MAPTLPQFNPARLRSYIFRIPLFTRVVLLLLVIFWISELQSIWNVVQWGALIPQEVGLSTSWCPQSCMRISSQRVPTIWKLTLLFVFSVYRLNTYPLIHVNFLHASFNALALTPLMERFEAEHGTLLTGAMFGGRELWLPNT